jgi:hypothetical protein
VLFTAPTGSTPSAGDKRATDVDKGPCPSNCKVVDYSR